MTGIIGAMEVEIKHILAKMQDVTEKSIGGIIFHLGLLEDRPVVVARCGVGKVHAAHAASVMTTHFDVSQVVNVGVAGGIAPEVEIGDVVIATGLVQHDVDVGDFGYPRGQVPGTPELFWGACQNLTSLTKEIADKVLENTGNKCHIGKMATGDQFIHDPA
ncbi:MAG: 5'-methylthioadenosine/S-adenosylhomocysteine nucleosidase, partial [Defluviitaleaceae bacterium]|nr:5'-methylthioadenosine/S-adenosylhomocysteine nucleosidase [Defluviitaleaceae bacterium]